MKTRLNKNSKNKAPSSNKGSVRNESIVLVYEQYFEKAFHIAYKYLRCQDLASDTVYSSLEKLLVMKEELFNKIDSLEFYFYTVVKNEALRRSRKKRQLFPIIENIDNINYIEEDFFNQLFNQVNLRLRVEKILSILSDKYPRKAQILRLFYLEGLLHKEISVVMSISESNSKVLLNRAKAAFKKLYKSLHPDDDPGTGPNYHSAEDKRQIQYTKYQNNTRDNFIDNSNKLDVNFCEKISLLEDIDEGYRMLLEDFDDKENVEKIIERKKEDFRNRLFANQPLNDLKNKGIPNAGSNTLFDSHMDYLPVNNIEEYDEYYLPMPSSDDEQKSNDNRGDEVKGNWLLNYRKVWLEYLLIFAGIKVDFLFNSGKNVIEQIRVILSSIIQTKFNDDYENLKVNNIVCSLYSGEGMYNDINIVTEFQELRKLLEKKEQMIYDRGKTNRSNLHYCLCIGIASYSYDRGGIDILDRYPNPNLNIGVNTIINDLLIQFNSIDHLMLCFDRSNYHDPVTKDVASLGWKLYCDSIDTVSGNINLYPTPNAGTSTIQRLWTMLDSMHQADVDDDGTNIGQGGTWSSDELDIATVGSSSPQ